MKKADALETGKRFADTMGWVSRIPNRIKMLSKDLEEARSHAANAPTVDERLDDLILFYNKYDLLVETLCDAAQYGPEPKLQAEYERLRSWMVEAYPRLRRYVTAYLQYDPADCQQSIAASGVACDAFEALFCAPTLVEFLRCDDGMMISRIMRTREALNLYGEHLRQLKGQR